MAAKSVTKVTEFNHSPMYPCGLFQINAGIDTMHALVTAQCILDFITTRLKDAVQEEMSAEEAYVQCLLADMAGALYRAAGAEA